MPGLPSVMLRRTFSPGDVVRAFGEFRREHAPDQPGGDARGAGSGRLGRSDPPGAGACSAGDEAGEAEQRRPAGDGSVFIHGAHRTAAACESVENRLRLDAVPHTGPMSLREKAELLRALHAGPGSSCCRTPGTSRAPESSRMPARGRWRRRVPGWQRARLSGRRGDPADEMLWLVERIARRCRSPVSADLEAGYGAPSETAVAAIAAGVAGLNLEDSRRRGLDPAGERSRGGCGVGAGAADRAGVPLVINARTDVFLRGDGSGRRGRAGNAYLEAGADCIFAIGVADVGTIGSLVRAINGAGRAFSPAPAGPRLPSSRLWACAASASGRGRCAPRRR